MSGKVRQLCEALGALLRRSQRQRRIPYARSTPTVEALEDRRLLSVDVSGVATFSQLEVDPKSYDATSVLVRFKPDVAAPDAYLRGMENALLRTSQVARSLDMVPGLYQLRLSPGLSVDAALGALNNDPHVMYVEPDYRLHIAGIPNDPRFDEQWDMHNTGQTGGTIDSDVDAPQAWDATTGTGSTIVAVIDTGVDYQHEDLAANIWTNPLEVPGDGIDNDNNGYIDDVHGYDFFNHDGDPMDDNSHGTHVAGTIGAPGDNGVGIAGLNWNVQIMAVKFLGADGSGSTSDAIEALRYAVDNGANITNASWGGDPYSQSLFDAISDARDAGNIFVAAAGNGNFLGIGLDNDAQPFYPASYDLDNIVAVAATDDNDQIAVFSNYGATSVDLAAPGVSTLSTLPGNSYGLNSGTSMAAPHVSGALSLVRDFNPTLNYRQIIDQVLTSVDPVQSLEGLTVTGGRLNVASALVPDTFGPQVAGIQPNGLTLDAVDHLTIVFDESIDPATFTLADVAQFTGPDGDIGPLTLTPVAGTNNRQFTLDFPSLTTPGDYQLIITPDIQDTFGNVMDQNNNGVGGEVPDDQFVGTFTLANTVARFDFGPDGSPVATGYTMLTRSDRYDAAVGYGWDVGTVYEISRAGGDDLTRDFNYTADATFALDVPNGEYDVIVTLGDTGMPHDQMGVYLEGVQYDSVSTAAGESVARTYRASVSDGQLSVRLKDLGGSDPWVMIDALDVVYAGPDTTGPQVVSVDPQGTVTGSADRFVVHFNETIDENTFTTDDVVVLEGPSGSIAPLSVNQLSGSDYEVVFDPQNDPGLYQLVLGANIADVGGNLLDQDGDGTGGKTPDDEYTATFTLELGPQYVARFDFGPAGSPLAAGYDPLTRYDRYDAAVGYGWDVGSVYEITRAGGDGLTIDFNYTKDATFALDLANGEYDVTVTLGDTAGAHDQMNILLEGVLVDTVTTIAGQSIAHTYHVSVSDGQLNLHLLDGGGSDPWVMINGLDVVYAGADTTGPRVLSVDTQGAVTGPIDRLVIDFSEAIDETTFTLDDVIALDAPTGAITPTAVHRITDSQYEVTFDAQNTAGAYRFELGSDITDVAGNLLDQDGDGNGGENPDDHFAVTFTLEPGLEYVARFDFGPAGSPLAEGYSPLTRYDRYDAAVGYGWDVGSVYEITRAGGEDLTIDFNYTADATFALDLPNGDYDVVVTLGDTAGAHDEMGILLEGVLVATHTTAAGQSVASTHRVTVTDGQLNVRLQDRGGSDPWVMIDGLDVIRVTTPTLAGDANLDGVVDGLDYLVWANAYPADPAAAPPGSPTNGDLNDDGRVDGLDYLVWAGNYGATTTASTALSVASAPADVGAVDATLEQEIDDVTYTVAADRLRNEWRLSLAFDSVLDAFATPRRLFKRAGYIS